MHFVHMDNKKGTSSQLIPSTTYIKFVRISITAGLPFRHTPIGNLRYLTLATYLTKKNWNIYSFICQIKSNFLIYYPFYLPL